MALKSRSDLICIRARRPAGEGPEAGDVLATVGTAINGKQTKPGNIVTALRRLPLAGAELDLSRRREEGCKDNL